MSLLTPGSSITDPFQRLPWACVGSLPGHSGGTAPDSHRVPRPPPSYVVVAAHPHRGGGPLSSDADYAAGQGVRADDMNEQNSSRDTTQVPSTSEMDPVWSSYAAFPPNSTS